jgi:glyoxylase-like metal-dependent hydrolase (beta-lactamase superfamily II)
MAAATEAKSSGSARTSATATAATFTVQAIPCLSDNYAYLISAPRAEGTRVCAVVDAGILHFYLSICFVLRRIYISVIPYIVNPERVLAAVTAAGLTKADILYCLTTHHHEDHAYVASSSHSSLQFIVRLMCYI